MRTVRLYGHQLGYTSFTQVTRGFALGLGAFDRFGGFVPLDNFDDEVDYPGGLCPVSVNTGMPSGLSRAKLLGDHTERWLMLAPNSNLIPERMREWLPELATALLSPSTWGVEVLRAVFGNKLPVHHVPHGVHLEYAMLPDARYDRLVEFERHGVFRVLHMTSTNSERKGTKLLLEAWEAFGSRPGEHNQLTLVCRREGYAEMMALAQAVRGAHVQPSDGAPYAYVTALYGQHHVVCQPSRAEGFGLIPLEAKACGLPVVMTACTGHADHVRVGSTVVVETGADAPIDDMDGACAPSLTAQAIYNALVEARSTYRELDAHARVSAQQIRDDHTWSNTTGKAMETLLK